MKANSTTLRMSPDLTYSLKNAMIHNQNLIELKSITITMYLNLLKHSMKDQRESETVRN